MDRAVRKTVVVARAVRGFRGAAVDDAVRSQSIESSKPTFGDRLRYWRDKHLATYRSQISLICVVGVLQAVLSGTLLWIVRGDNEFVLNAADRIKGSASVIQELFWVGWVFMNEPEVMTSSIRPVERLVGALCVFAGIIFFSIILGFVVDAIRANIEAIASGSSKVVERDHIVVLGFSPACISLISEMDMGFADAEETGARVAEPWYSM
jgi:hypothetical protein